MVSGMSGYTLGEVGPASGVAGECTFRQSLLTAGKLLQAVVPLAAGCATSLGVFLEPVCSLVSTAVAAVLQMQVQLFCCL